MKDFEVILAPKIGKIILIGLLLTVLGCGLPFPGPYKGRVTDSASGKPIRAANVEAEWWCHDNPLPDGPGGYFVKSSTMTDKSGHFHIDKQTRRGGLFGANFVLKVRKFGYIPTNLIAMRQGEKLPTSTQEYPFINTVPMRVFPEVLDIKLDPAARVLLKAMKSGKPFDQKIAREKLIKLVGKDFKHDANKWEEALDSGITKQGVALKRRRPSQDKACPCPNAADRPGQPKLLRNRIREFVNAGGADDLERVRRFLDDGIDPDSQNYACRTALMKAAYYGKIDPLTSLSLFDTLYFNGLTLKSFVVQPYHKGRHGLDTAWDQKI